MNNLRLSLAVGALTLALALPAFAGFMDTPVTSPPPPPPVTGEMDTPGMASATGETSFPGISADPVTEIALSLMQSMLALF